MKLWLIIADTEGYDVYDSAVVAAETADNARRMHPDGSDDWDGKEQEYGAWVDSDQVKVREIGVAADGITGVICASFNAG